MKAHLLLIPAMLAAAAAIADDHSTLNAYQALTRSQTSVAAEAHARVLGEHPAVLVSKSWRSRGIDINTLPLSHPALEPRAKSQHAAAARVLGDRSFAQ